MLPGYVFVRITAVNTPAIHRNPWVQFLTVGKDRLNIPEAEIELLRRITGEKSMELDWQLVDTESWQSGQPVELIGGPLTGIKGTFINTHNKGKLIIELGLLPTGMGLQTTVPAAWVHPLGASLRAAKTQKAITA